jgi:hypothetical protein
MSRTQGRNDADTAYGDGHVFIPIGAGNLTSGTGTYTRNASGSYSVNLGNSQTAVLGIPLRDLILRYGVQDWLQEQFGSAVSGGAQGLTVGGYTALVSTTAAAGTNVNVAVNTSVGFTVGRKVLAGTQNTFITAIPDATHITLASLTASLTAGLTITQDLFTTPAGLTGAPPYTAGTNAPPNNLLPVTAPRPKGIALKAIYPVYAAAGAALSLNTIGITKTVFANNTAPAVTTILANAANGLATATQAQPYVTPINLATPITFLTSKYSEYIIEWDVTTAGGGTAQLFGIFVDIGFNYN